ncbi:beta-N-acetylhexosaminidase [Gelidibacter salicanalis]|uniref:beta-N-acetylhexosaminidase n=1 Tax=Gelidibacter salicanalis TaxID=291193 RepID=A0A934KTE7_9FLAO|nr:beta-N-acetylhexosaminidase [Gelidibacter salicanalis]MBJ7879833.1 beta-N-acetylhexosaminidase [Gelidibacter salicanalis]
MKKTCILLIVFICSIAAYAQVIPAPESLKFNKGHFVLDTSTGITLDGLEPSESTKLTNYLIDKVETETGVRISSKKGNSKNILFEVLRYPSKNLGEEGYILNITTNEIHIAANSNAGLFYGVQSLLQYIIANNIQTPIQLPNLSISDKPNVAWRGMVMDVSRHFFNVTAIKEVLDLMAFYKLNVFHWHLADNEGWRLEIKKYPKLTEVGAWRTEIPGSVMYKQDSTYAKKLDGKPYQYGGFYTQEQVKDIVDYAKDRNITVVPEIDVPGHSGAALTAYPEFSCEKHQQESPNSTLWNGVVNPLNVNLNYCAGQESTFEFLEDVFTEVMALFPSKYIHVGGDEVDKSYWEKCDACQKRKADEGLKDENELQSYFLKRIAKFLEDNDRKLIGWDEILEGGAPVNATVMSWRGEKGGIEAAKLKQDVIMTPNDPLYFNRHQVDSDDEPYAPAYSINTLERVYNYNLIPEELSKEEARYILGGQFAVWTEFISSVEHLEYTLLPRMPAFAENMWSTSKNKDYNKFIERLNLMHYDYWKANGIRFHPKAYLKSVY